MVELDVSQHKVGGNLFMVCGFMPTPFLIGGCDMCLIHPRKIEIELLPDAIKALDDICDTTGVSRSEIIEKMLLKYMPIEEERAFSVIVDDIITRTERLSEEGQRRVLLRVKELVENIL